jgi:D-glycero-D-manno-heptose 1,7-bisphosphate phosphatase
MASVPQLFDDPRLGSDLLWRDVRVERLPHPAPALFLDRDGVIIEEKGYISKPEDVDLLAGMPELISAAKRLGMAVVEVTNQAGIGRGYFDWSDFVRVEDRLTDLLAQSGVAIDAVFACPYHPEGEFPYRKADHAWRKPNAGMLFEAADVLNLALDRSVMIGDKDLDQSTAKAAKLKYGIHLLTGYGRENEAAARAVASESFPVHILRGADEAVALLNAWSLRRAEIAEDRKCAS